jgi:hypothetical protein
MFLAQLYPIKNLLLLMRQNPIFLVKTFSMSLIFNDIEKVKRMIILIFKCYLIKKDTTVSVVLTSPLQTTLTKVQAQITARISGTQQKKAINRINHCCLQTVKVML